MTRQLIQAFDLHKHTFLLDQTDFDCKEELFEAIFKFEAKRKKWKNNSMQGREILRVQNLKKYFPVESTGEVVRAVDDVSFSIFAGETLGLVGESGCGKSTVGKCILRLIEPTGGQIFFKDENILSLHKERLRQLRRQMQIIFQDPYSSLNPRLTVYSIVSEPLKIHNIGTETERREIVADLLKKVGLDPDYMNRYPHEFSGGQRQRIGIARAIALRPELVVCDEPVSALDVSVQAQVINLLQDLQEEFGLTYLFISHGLAVVRHVSNRIAVMYLGRIVEIAESASLYEDPLHPYTKALLSAIPVPEPKRKRERIILQGDVPTPINPPSGCRFRTRCPFAVEECSRETPQLRQVKPNHFVACILA